VSAADPGGLAVSGRGAPIPAQRRRRGGGGERQLGVRRRGRHRRRRRGRRHLVPVLILEILLHVIFILVRFRRQHLQLHRIISLVISSGGGRVHRCGRRRGGGQRRGAGFRRRRRGLPGPAVAVLLPPPVAAILIPRLALFHSNHLQALMTNVLILGRVTMSARRGGRAAVAAVRRPAAAAAALVARPAGRRRGRHGRRGAQRVVVVVAQAAPQLLDAVGVHRFGQHLHVLGQAAQGLRRPPARPPRLPPPVQRQEQAPLRRRVLLRRVRVVIVVCQVLHEDARVGQLTLQHKNTRLTSILKPHPFQLNSITQVHHISQALKRSHFRKPTTTRISN